MDDIICEIKIKIKEFYPKLKIIPYDNYDCVISYNEDKLSIPLKNIEKNIFKNEIGKINSDLTYQIELINRENNYSISSSSFVIPYIRLTQSIKMKIIKYEQQIKFMLENDTKENIFGPGISVGSIFLKFAIEINTIQTLNSNIFLSNNINSIKSQNSEKNNQQNISDFNLTSSLTNFTNKTREIKENKDIKNIKEKKQNKHKSFKCVKSNRIFGNYLSYKASEITSPTSSKIHKINSNIYKSPYIPTSPTLQKKHEKIPSSLFDEQKAKKFYPLSPSIDIKKIYDNTQKEKKVGISKYTPKPWYSIKKYARNPKADKEISQALLPTCFSENSFNEKKDKKDKRPSSQKKKSKKNVLSPETKKNFVTISKDIEEVNMNNINMNKTEGNEKIRKKFLKQSSNKIRDKICNMNNTNISYHKKKNSKTSNDINKSIQNMKKMDSKSKKNVIKSFMSKKSKKKVTRNYYGETKENKKTESTQNLDESKYKDFNLIKNVKNQEDLKHNIISMLDYLKERNKEAKENHKKINVLDNKYLLYREKIVMESKKYYSLQSQDNVTNAKNFIHVKINSKYNNIIFNKMSKIKTKELNIIKIILDNKNEKNKDPKKIVQEKLKQQKQVHLLLNLVRDLIKTYGNLSHLYDEDNNKKILFKSLFLRYSIREKEWNKNDNLKSMYDKIINEKISNKNLQKLKSQEFNAIKEEEENEEEEEGEKAEKEDKKEKEENKENKEDNNINEENKKESTEGNNIKIIDDNDTSNKDDTDNKDNSFYEMKDSKIKTGNNNMISIDENIDTNNIKSDLINKNIIINNFIINNK